MNEAAPDIVAARHHLWTERLREFTQRLNEGETHDGLNDLAELSVAATLVIDELEYIADALGAALPERKC